MDSGFDFQCAGCGNCCKNIIGTHNGIEGGLILTEKEVELFPQSTIAPQYAIGTEEKKKVILYQMKMGPCPHLDPENKCKIYEKRPLVCRSYPMMANCISSKCKGMTYKKPTQNLRTFSPISEMREANDKMRRYLKMKFRKNLTAGTREWEFDLATEKWLPKMVRS